MILSSILPTILSISISIATATTNRSIKRSFSTPSKLIDLFPERELWERGIKHVIGVDEVGRGPLAGSVYACAVCITIDTCLDQNVADSKSISEKKRQVIYDTAINDKSLLYSIGIVNASRIDEINILQSALEAMQIAVLTLCKTHSLNHEECYVLVDGNKLPRLPSLKCRPIVRGDASVYSIALASVIAKVTRDKYMKDMHELYPNYGFAKHKGYPTKEHIMAIHKHGPCAIHRLSFRPLKGRSPLVAPSLAT